MLYWNVTIIFNLIVDVFYSMALCIPNKKYNSSLKVVFIQIIDNVRIWQDISWIWVINNNFSVDALLI